MGNSQDVVEFFKNMKICSQITDRKQVSREDMEKILEVGRLSVSSFGLEPWKFLVVENKYIKSQICKLARGIKKEMKQADYMVIILARNYQELDYNSPYVRYMMEEIQETPEDEINKRIDNYKLFLEEDFNIISDSKSITGWIGKQTYIPMANMMVAANQLGIVPCPIEGFNKAKLEEFLIHENLYDRDKYNISCILTFGYSDQNKNYPKKRRPKEEVIEWIE